MLETDLKAFLADRIAAVAGRVYPLDMPKGDVPAAAKLYPVLIYQFISGPSSYHFTGESNPKRRRVQISTRARTYLEAVEIAETVKSEMSGFSGVMGGTAVQGCFKNDEGDLPDPDATAGDVLHGVRLDFTIHYTE